MSWDGSSLSTPVREPEVSKSDVMSSEEKQLWATNFNMMFGNSGAAYINGKLVTVMSRDEQSTTDEELFAVRKWDAKTGDLLLVIADKPVETTDAATGKPAETQPAWSRRLELPFRVDADKANAKFTNGILRIELPKAEKTGIRHIAIEG